MWNRTSSGSASTSINQSKSEEVVETGPVTIAFLSGTENGLCGIFLVSGGEPKS